jgi:hypothetical protein
MWMSIPVNAKRRGRPPGQTVPVPVQLRLSEEQAAALDALRADEDGESLPRSEALRRILVEHLKAKGYLK